MWCIDAMDDLRMWCGGISYFLSCAYNKLFFFFFDWPRFANCTSKSELGPTMGQEKSLQKMALVSLGFKQSQAINWVNNESKSQQKA